MRKVLLIGALSLFLVSVLQAKKSTPKDTLLENAFANLKWRSIGPALVSGRVADIAVDKNNFAHYYVAAAAGHVWETHNNGASFNPIFDNHSVYSIGCITIDPNNQAVIWIGTGENNHQRAIGYGNGIYKSVDGGKSWVNKGLKDSRQIGEILVDPRNSNVIYVAAEGSIWKANKERGVYKSIDGGETWIKVLFVSENTGISSLSFDTQNPDIIYAGAEQRRRKQYTKIGGGPESAFYKSTDAGETWTKLTNGIPSVDKGGMAIAVSPADPNYVYVMFEASNGEGGFYLSKNKGGSFEKMNSYNSSGQYYSEIYPDPNNKNKVVSVDTYSRYTLDAGKTWKTINTEKRHVDDHAFWQDPLNADHFFIAGDGGLYESWDLGQSFTFKNTLPITQFYRVNVDNSEPFYWVYGGTQDNNSIGGPSRNRTKGGVSNTEWIATLGGDGFFQAIDKENPNIVYSAYQYGNIYRYDKLSGEKIKIKPQEAKTEKTYRWNWDAPFIMSEHDSKTIYIGSNKLFKSIDRGNSWTKISEDLTRNEDRNQFKVMGKYWPLSAVAKDVSTSQWGTIVSLAESPVKAGLLYVGTDDGLIQVSENDGTSWTKISTFPNVGKYCYVSDIFASPIDENLVFASFNNLKNDDFTPYLLKSMDKGKTWISISNNLPDNQSINCIVQDKTNPNLLFVGTELGIYFSVDAGLDWNKLGSGMPDISVKDIQIQEREHDIVVATFGRGIYILDNYSVLQNFKKEDLNQEAKIYPIKDALIYVENDDRYGRGDAYYLSKNPQFGLTFDYFFKDTLSTLKELRLKEEGELFDKSEKIPQPTKAVLDKESQELVPYLVFEIMNTNGELVRKLYTKADAGMHRMNWNLRYMSTNPVHVNTHKFNVLENGNDGVLALPGDYSVEMYLVKDNKRTQLTSAVSFKTKLLKDRSLPAVDEKKKDEFYSQVADLWRVYKASNKYIRDLKIKNQYLQQAAHNINNSTLELENEIGIISNKIDSIIYALNGPYVKASWEEVPPIITPLNIRLNELFSIAWESTSAPTQTQKTIYTYLNSDLNTLLIKIKDIDVSIKDIEQELDNLKAPYTPGRMPK